jgi:hypothetical protein
MVEIPYTLGWLRLLIKLIVPGVDGILVNMPTQPEHTAQGYKMYYKNNP